MSKNILFSGSYIDLKSINNVYLLYFHYKDNRFSLPFVKEMSFCLDKLETLNDVSALITISSGKYFTNGIDLKWSETASSLELDELHKELRNIMVRFMLYPFPCIAGINGHCFGGGAAFAFCHDYRIMREDRGWICIPAVDIGITLPYSFVNLVKFKTNSNIAKQILLEGKRFGGKEAERQGIIDKAVPINNFEDDCIKYAQQLFKKDKSTYGAFKLRLNGNIANELKTAESFIPKSKL